MTLSRGDKVVKLDANGEPIKDGESYVEYEVFDLGQHNGLFIPGNVDQDTFMIVLLKVIR